MGRILAIDYGRKRTGIAVTDPMQMIANGLTTVLSVQVIQFLKDYLQKETVDAFVVGYARQLNHADSESMTYIKPFVKSLGKHFQKIPVYMIDERFTSSIAQQSMIDGGLKKKKRQNKALVDTISATLILQSFLEQKSSGKFKF